MGYGKEMLGKGWGHREWDCEERKGVGWDHRKGMGWRHGEGMGFRGSDESVGEE